MWLLGSERFENRYWCAELHRLRGVFLAAMGADEAQIEASLSAAITTAKQQKSVSLEKRAEATYGINLLNVASPFWFEGRPQGSRN